MTSPYRTVLRTPGARRFAIAGLVGRMPMSMMTIAVLLTVRHAAGSYAIAGAASAAHTLTQASMTPVVGRLVDRRGQSAVLPRLLAVFLTGIAVLVLAAATHAPVGFLFVGAVLAGAGQLPYPSLVRTRWSYLLGGSPQMSTALALESAADEAVFTVGPVIVTGLAALNPLLAPLFAGGLALAGTVPFVTARSSEPPRVAVGSGSSAWRIPALWVLITSSILIGTVFGSCDVAMIAFAQRHGASALSGLLLAAIAFGSLVAGLWYGARSWKRDVAIRYRLSIACLAVGSLPALAASNLWQMAPAAFLIGISVAPTLIASSGLITRVVPPGALTEGFTWQSTGINIGVACGAALSGVLIDAFGVRSALLVLPVSATLGALVALAGAGLLAPRMAPEQRVEPAALAGSAGS